MKGLAATELFHAAHLEDPYPLYARLRAQGPVCPLHGSRAFYVAGHAAVEEAVRRHEEFSARLTGVLLRDPQGGASLFEFAGAGTASDVIATADEPEHAAQRRLLMPSMKASRTVQMEEPVRAFARERIAAFVRAGGGVWPSRTTRMEERETSRKNTRRAPTSAAASAPRARVSKRRRAQRPATAVYATSDPTTTPSRSSAKASNATSSASGARTVPSSIREREALELVA